MSVVAEWEIVEESFDVVVVLQVVGFVEESFDLSVVEESSVVVVVVVLLTVV